MYGRKAGRTLTPERKNVLGDLLEILQIPKDSLKEDGSLTPSALFPPPYKECWLEIGFGNGEHVKALMEQNPSVAYIACEPFINGMSSFLKSIKEEAPHDNIRVLMDDAMLAARSLSDNCVDGIYILNPDPWPKRRHHERRMVSHANLDVFSRILKPGGQLIMTSDVPELAKWMEDHATAHPDFEMSAQTKEDKYTTPDNWIKTRYEQKGAKGAERMHYLFFFKK